MLRAPRLVTRSSESVLARVRARARVKRMLVLGALVAAAVTVAVAASHGSTDDADAAAARPARTLQVAGGNWFALGANLPWLRYACDFGCGAAGGARGNRARLDTMLRTMSRRGVRVVRWYLFPRDAWQVRRAADGTPTSLSRAALIDLDVALQLAQKHDVYLLPVVLPEPTKLPATWFTDPAQQAALARTLRPMFARYRSNRHLLGWEVATGGDALVDAGTATREQVRAQAKSLIDVVDAAAPSRRTLVSPSDVSRIDGWVGLGADAYDPMHADSATGEACASCRSTAYLTVNEGADAPVIVGGFDTSSEAAAAKRIESYRTLGYAGALAWSWRRTGGLGTGLAASQMPDTATWRIAYAHANVGPHARPLNPCYGPREREFMCPNLQMSVPADVSLGHLGRRTILYSTNSLNSRGLGPASIRGRRNGRYTMAAKQLLHRRDGRVVSIATGAKLLFKAVPGQYRYWKWNGAARMELWRLDSTGAPLMRVRQGPKTVYCLRDLSRTKGSLPRSPRARVYPGCSQRLSQQAVTLGTSVGWSDRYPASYHENWIDVTGLRGCFAYVHIADPTNVVYENDEDDNESHVIVRLPWKGTNAGCPGAKRLPTTGEGGVY